MDPSSMVADLTADTPMAILLRNQVDHIVKSDAKNHELYF